MHRKEYDTLQDGDVVKVRGCTRQGPVIACVVEKGSIQFAYETADGSVTIASLPYPCLEFVSSHPADMNSAPGDTVIPSRLRNRYRGQ